MTDHGLRSSPQQLDGIEIKVTVARSRMDEAAEVFGLAPGEGESRRIYFCEALGESGTGLVLLDHGIILRLRANADGEGDSTVKLRPFEGHLHDRWRERRQDDTEIRMEGDWVSDRHVVAVSAVSQQSADEVEGAAARTRELAKLLSRVQEEFLKDNTEAPVLFDRLRIVGSIAATKWKAGTVRLSKKLVAERWEVGQLRFLEVSLRVDDEAEARRAQAELTGVMAEHDLLNDVEQETKTRLVLEYCLRADT